MICDSNLRGLVSIKLLTAPFLNLCLTDGCHPLGFIVASGWMMYTCFQSVLGMFAARLVSECFTDVFFAQCSARTAPQFSCACACAGPAAHAYGKRSTTALDSMRQVEKALLPLILRLTPSPSSSTSQGWCAEGDADPTVLLMPAVPDPVQLAPWLPVQPGASPRSCGPRPPVLRAAATATGPARSGPLPLVGPVAVAAARPACL